MRVEGTVLVCGVSQREGMKEGKPTGKIYHNATLYGLGEDATSHEFGISDPKLISVIQGLSGKQAKVTINLREFKGTKNFDLVAIKGV